MTNAFVSQTVAENLTLGDPNAKSSQVVTETLGLTSPNLFATQVVTEALAFTNPHLFATQAVAETLGFTNPYLKATQVVVEILVVNWNSPMPPIYPTLPGLTYDTKWSPIHYNMATQTSDTGADVDLGYAETPLHDFELTYSVLRDNFNGYIDPNYNGTEFKTMMGFWLMLGGARGRFLFWNVDDNTVVAQSQGDTDGTSSTYTLSRTFGVTDYNATEPVGYIDTTKTFNVYLDGVLQDPSTYDVLTALPVNQQIKFHATPTAGQAITTDMSYYYYCKFPDNQNTFEKFMNQLWLLNTVKLHSCRAGT